MDKETIIAQIRQRILDEYRKHSRTQDWALIAALRIYTNHIKDLKKTK